MGYSWFLIGKASMIRHADLNYEEEIDPICNAHAWSSHCWAVYNPENLRFTTDAVSLAELLLKTWTAVPRPHDYFGTAIGTTQIDFGKQNDRIGSVQLDNLQVSIMDHEYFSGHKFDCSNLKIVAKAYLLS